MIEYVLEDAQKRYMQGRAAFEQHDAAGVLKYYHGALESLVRWSLVRHGADPAKAFDAQAITWPDLLAYLDVRAVPAEYLAQIADAHQRYDALLEGQPVALTPKQAVEFAAVVEQIFRKLWPRTTEERQRADLRAQFGQVTPPAEAIAASRNARETRMDVQLPATPPPPPAAEPPVAVTAPPAPVEAETVQPTMQVPLPNAEDQAPPTRDLRRQRMMDEAPSRRRSNANRMERPATAAYGGRSVTPPDTQVHVGISEEETLRRSALERGQRLRQLRAEGLTYCPNCRSTIPLSSTACPHCDFDIAAYQHRIATARPTKTARPGFLDRLFGRNPYR